jgi:cytochrome P450
MTAKKDSAIDMLFALRCFTIDMVTQFCFAKSVNAINAPDYKAPIVEAMHTSNPTFVMLKHFPLFRKTLFGLPPWLAIKASPETAGLTNLQVILGEQVHEVLTNPASLEKAPHPIIYHRLLDKEVNKGQPLPDAISLREEAAALMFGGGDSAANTLTIGLYHILSQQHLYKRLKDEIYQAWPSLIERPTYETLQKLPILTATIKESLRYAPGVPSALLRIVPPSGAMIGGKSIPGGTIVGMSTVLVHRSSEVFDKPEVFDIERWMGPDAAGLDKWLVSFSKGPRSCLGINLAYCEMYIALATLIRKLDMKLDGTKAEDLVWRDVFLPFFYGKRLKVRCEAVKN